MNKKGQISFDLYFAVMFAIVLSQQLFTVSSQFSQAANETSILSQEKQTANNIAAILSSSIALSEGKSFSIEYIVPAIFDIDKRGQQACSIKISVPNGCNCRLIAVSYNTIAGQALETQAYASAGKPAKITTPSGTQNGPDYEFKCGDKIKIEKD